MGTFWKSFTREVGKNTGKWASNKIFGNTGWATPRRHIIEVEERKKQRVEAREYKQRQQQIERDRKERAVRLKQMEKEHAEIEKKDISSIIDISIIPYTYRNTTLKYIKTQDEVNIEFDILGKYINESSFRKT